MCCKVTELDDALTPIEKHLSKVMKLLRVKGKQGRGVPVLFEPNDWTLLTLLLKDPNCENEVFLFQNYQKKPLRGHDMLQELTKSLGDKLEKPDAIRATMLRKYLATVIQVMALPKYQTKWVAEHLGHSLEVHGKHYRQSLDTVEVAKISKLMYLVDHCKMNSVQGMNLDSIDNYLEKEDIMKSVNADDYEQAYTSAGGDDERATTSQLAIERQSAGQEAEATDEPEAVNGAGLAIVPPRSSSTIAKFKFDESDSSSSDDAVLPKMCMNAK